MPPGSLDRHRRRLRHAGKPADAAAARQPEQHGLGLIVERVRGEHIAARRPCAPPRRAADSAPAAPPPGCRSSASCRSSAACGARRRACGRAWRRPAPRACDSGRRPWSTVTAMSLGPRLLRLAPARHQPQQRGGIRAAGRRQSEEPESRRNSREEAPRLGGRDAACSQQRTRFCSRSTPCFTVFEARGYLRPTSARWRRPSLFD